MFRRRADEGQVMLFHDLREMRVLGQEAIAGMDRIGASDLACGDQGGDVQVGLRAGRRADADAFICEPYMHGVDVSSGVCCDSRDAQFAAGALDAQRNLAPVGDQNFCDHDRLLDDDQGGAELNGLLVFHQDPLDRTGTGGRDLVHRFHRLDDDDRLAFADLIADFHECRGGWFW